MRIATRIAIGAAFVVVLLLIANGVMLWRANWRLQSKLSAIRADGNPASIAELAPAAVPDDDNAALYLQRISPRIKEFSKEYSLFYQTPLGVEYGQARERGENATEEQLAAIRAILDKYPDVEQAIAHAAQCNQYSLRMDYSLNHTAFLAALIDHQSDVRSPARFLSWRMEVLLAAGEHEQAVERGIQGLKLARLHENEPTIMSYLIANALQGTVASPLYDALAAGLVSPELHAALDDELARREDPRRLRHALATERALTASWSDAMFDQTPAPLLARTFGWWLKSHQIEVLDAMEEYMSLSERPSHEWQSVLAPTNPTLPTSERGVLTDMLSPSLRSAFQAHARGLVLSRGLRIHNALRQFAEKNGREAVGLEELNLLDPATIDPYSGQPLKLKQTPEGWLIYSIMENGVDDGGDFKHLKDYGVGPPKLRLEQ
jgi:hypothetical protein